MWKPVAEFLMRWFFLMNCSFIIIESIPEYLKSRVIRLEYRARKIIGNEHSIIKSAKVLRTKSAKHVHRCLSGDVCTRFKNYFEICSRYNTRNRGVLLRVPKVKLETAGKGFHFQGALVINKLPIEIRREKNFLCFCKLLKNLWFLFLIKFRQFWKPPYIVISIVSISTFIFVCVYCTQFALFYSFIVAVFIIFYAYDFNRTSIF